MKTIQIVAVLVVSLALLSWVRSDGDYDFDIRTVLPFLRGPEVSLHDWGGLILIIVGVWGVSRLRRPVGNSDRASDSVYDSMDDYEPEDDVDGDAGSGPTP